MKLPLKYFLLICLLLGAVVGPIGYRKYQEWKKRRAAIPTRTFVIKNLVADEVKAVIEAVYSQAVKPVDGELPTVIVRADPRTNSVIVAANKKQIDEIADVIEAIDKSPSSAPVRIIPARPGAPDTFRLFLPRYSPFRTPRPAATDLS